MQRAQRLSDSSAELERQHKDLLEKRARVQAEINKIRGT